MKVILQRVSEADVRVDEEIVGAIQDGLCLLVGIEADDTTKELEWMAKKVAQLRIFRDEEGRMNRSLLEVGGAVLAISQFTLMADAVKGRRPSFVAAAPPEIAEPLFEQFCDLLREQGPVVETGRFGAHMMVRLINDGPVTIPLERRASS